MGVITFLLSPVGRWIAGALAILAIIGGIYFKGRMDGKGAYRSQVEREITDAVRKGNSAREKALRDFDNLPDADTARGVPDDGWKRP